MRRRTWLGLAALLPLARAGDVVAASIESGKYAGVPRSGIFTAYVDTLIPADATPAASALAVDLRLLAEAQKSRQLRGLYLRGLQWLQREAERTGAASFADLDEDARAAIIRQAEQSAAASVPARFFEHTLDAAMRAYYSQPRSWAGFGLDGPPQPLGYMDYQEPHGR